VGVGSRGGSKGKNLVGGWGDTENVLLGNRPGLKRNQKGGKEPSLLEPERMGGGGCPMGGAGTTQRGEKWGGKGGKRWGSLLTG